MLSLRWFNCERDRLYLYKEKYVKTEYFTVTSSWFLEKQGENGLYKVYFVLHCIGIENLFRTSKCITYLLFFTWACVWFFLLTCASRLWFPASSLSSFLFRVFTSLALITFVAILTIIPIITIFTIIFFLLFFLFFLCCFCKTYIVENTLETTFFGENKLDSTDVKKI